MKNSFCTLLSEESLFVHGTFLMGKIRISLTNHTPSYEMIEKLFPNDTKCVTIGIIIDCLVGIFTRLRAKDFCYKLFQKGAKLKATTRTV